MKKLLCTILILSILLSISSGFGISANAKNTSNKTISTALTPHTGEHTPAAPVKENVIEADCLEPGSYDEVIYCSVCGEELSRETIETKPLGHDFIAEPGEEPTCEDEGVITYFCMRCDEVVDEFIPALGHDWGNWEPVKPAGCKEAGIEQRICKRDASHTDTRETAKLPHTLVTESGIAPTCEKPGTTDKKYCSVCKEVVQDHMPIPPTGEHKWGEWRVTTEATCATAGEQTRVCEYNKQHKQTREIPATGKHAYVGNLKTAATTQHPGEYVYTCSICGAERSSTKIAQIASVALSTANYSYTNTEKKPAVTVKDTDGKTISNIYYTVTYSKNIKVGTASVTVAFKGNYAGTVTRKFTITLAKPTVQVSKVSQAAVALKWNKVLGAQYYRIYEYNTKSGKYTSLAKTTALTYSVKQLAAGSTHYFLVRAYFLNKAGEQVGNPYTASDCVKGVVLCKAPTVKVSVSGKTVTLKWAKVSGAKFYRIYEYNYKTKKYTTLLKSTTKLSAGFSKQAKGNHYYLIRTFNANSKGSVYTTKNLVKTVVKK